MKKNIFVLLLAAACINAQAQLSIGVKAGLNRYALTGEDKSYINRIHVGGFVQIPIKGMLVLQPELLYAAEGNGFEEENVKVSQNLAFVNIPLMLKLVTRMGLYAEAGPQVGLLLSAKNKESGSPDGDIKKFFKTTSFSFGAGVGYQFKMGVGIGARYNVGLTDLLKNEGPEPMKSTGLQVGLFYKFSLKK